MVRGAPCARGNVFSTRLRASPVALRRKQVQVAAEEVQTVYDSAHAAHCLALSMNRSSQLSLRSGPVRGG